MNYIQHCFVHLGRLYRQKCTDSLQMTPSTWIEPSPDHVLPSASCVFNQHQLQDNYITDIMRLLRSFYSSCRLLMAPLCCFCLRSRGQQVHLVWAAPVAQRLLQLQKVLRVSGRPRFPDMQRGRLLPRLRQRDLSRSPSLKRVWPNWLPSKEQRHNSSNLSFVALCVSCIGFWQIKQFSLLKVFSACIDNTEWD